MFTYVHTFLTNNWINGGISENYELFFYIERKFENTNGIIKRHEMKKDRQCDGQKKKDKRKNNDLQNILQAKTKDRVTRIP
jgi:hypothetical protein